MLHEIVEPDPHRYPNAFVASMLRDHGIDATIDQVDYVNLDVNIRIAEGRLKRFWDTKVDTAKIAKGKSFERFNPTTGTYLRVYRTLAGKDIIGFFLSYGKDPHPPELRKYPFETQWHKAVQGR